MSDDYPIDSPPWLDATERLPQEHRPNTLRDTERESYRELIAEIGYDKIWANRLRAVLDDSDYWIGEAARRGLEAKADAARLQQELETIRAAEAQRAQESAACDDLLSDRDRFYDMAESLADAAADLLNVNIGEHSNINDPHRNALDAIKAAHASPYGEIINGSPDVVRMHDDLLASEAARTAAENLLARLEVKIEHLGTMCAHLAHPEVRDEVDACLGLIGKHNERTVTE